MALALVVYSVVCNFDLSVILIIKHFNGSEILENLHIILYLYIYLVLCLFCTRMLIFNGKWILNLSYFIH